MSDHEQQSGMNNGSRGSTIRIFLVDGTPQGIRVLDRPNWTGCVLAFARSDYAAARTRPETATTGAYVLVGPDAEGSRDFRVYIGEGDDVRVRLDQHQSKKDFWTQGFVAATKDSSLNKAHVRYLESRLLTIAREADRAVLDNGTEPPTPPLSEPEQADMESYLDQVLPLLALAGAPVFDVVEPQTPRVHAAAPSAESAPADTGTVYHLEAPLTKAQGRDDARGFTVFSGSVGRSQVMEMTPSYRALRDRLVAEGVLCHEGDHVRLTRTYVFESPSAAASVLTGGSKNGRTTWKDSAGRTLKQNQEATAVTASG